MHLNFLAKYEVEKKKMKKKNVRKKSNVSERPKRHLLETMTRSVSSWGHGVMGCRWALSLHLCLGGKAVVKQSRKIMKI